LLARHRVPIAASALAIASTATTAACKHGSPQLGGDAEWYRAQDEHIKLRLPLVEEARQGWWYEVIRRLRDNGESALASCPRDGSTLLHLAAMAGKRRLVEELLNLGASPTAVDRRGRTPFLCAAESGSEAVMATLSIGDPEFDVNKCDDSGSTALALSARQGNVRIVRWLCRHAHLEPTVADRYGVCALHKAVSFGQLATVEVLLNDRRVQVDQPVGRPTVPDSFAAFSGGETSLHLASSHTYTYHHTQHTKIAKRLLEAGADPNLCRADGRNAVHCAAAAGNVEILRYLLASGRVRSWHLKDAEGSTARDLARHHGHAAVLTLLPTEAPPAAAPVVSPG